MIRSRVSKLMKEAGVTSMDLVRAGMAQGTAYGLAKDHIRMIHIDTLEKLCDFFTTRLGRLVTPNDILDYTQEEK